MKASLPHVLFAPTAWLPTGWANDVRIEIDASGVITAVTPQAPSGGADRLAGPTLPGMPNLHSHAFQRAMAGRAERRAPSADADNFWTWRETMYGLAAKLTPETAYAIAAQLYIELARGGYSAVAEFHYVHRNPAGETYANPAEMALAHVRAARDVGLGITMLPVVYQRGGFDDRPLTAHQARFAASPAEAVAIAEAVRAAYAEDPDVAVGIAPHSLRAVSAADLAEIVRLTAANDWPIHIHVAEQPQEVADCRAQYGASPVQWLLDHAPVDRRWCLVHATHVDATEIAAIARSGAVVGLCPTTEANLGDGVFPFEAFAGNAAGHAGRFGIGSDSNISRSPVEELRLLEYGQRLTTQRRNVAATAAQPAVAAHLWRTAAIGGAQALGRAAGEIAVGKRCDLIVLDESAGTFAGIAPDESLDAFVFSGSEPLVRDLVVSGRPVMQDGAHPQADRVLRDFRQAMQTLRA